MSKVKYTVDVDEFICTALGQIRTMDKTRDYSSLMAVVERIQYHANMMESAISAAWTKKYTITKYCKRHTDGKITDEEFTTEVKEIMSKYMENPCDDYDE